MAWRPMEGVKVLEVAQFTFAPSAGAVLADWGADVVKVEHAEYGDAQRGLTIGAGARRPVRSSPSWSTRIGESGASAWPSKCRVDARC